MEEELELALNSHLKGDLSRAEALYLSMLEKVPDQPDALHYLGILMHQRDRSDAALELVLKSLQLDPRRADWHNDMGNILAERALFSPAAEAFLNSIELDSGNANTWNNLGSVLEKLQRFDEAESAYKQAIALGPEFESALNNLASLLFSRGREIEAAEYHCRAYVLGPSGEKPKSMLGIAYYKLGRIEEAAEIYRQWMMEEPDNPVARHLYAACSKTDVPLRASNAYIEKAFDDFSVNFDTRLEALSYQGPQLIAHALAKAVSPGVGRIALDAGCGTGLCGPLIKPHASRLIGVDLSSGMLEGAKQQGVYDELIRMELTEYLSCQMGGFDLIVAADTLNYFGVLDEVFGVAWHALRGEGLLIFTIEEAEGEGGYCINPHGRYSHGRAYLLSVLAEKGFDIMAVESAVLRYEFGSPVKTLVVTASRPAI